MTLGIQNGFSTSSTLVELDNLVKAATSLESKVAFTVKRLVFSSQENPIYFWRENAEATAEGYYYHGPYRADWLTEVETKLSDGVLVKEECFYANPLVPSRMLSVGFKVWIEKAFK